jgi:cytochrome P450
MLAISLEVMIRAVVGIREAELVERFRDAFLGMMKSVHPLFLYARFLQRPFGGRGPYARFLRHRREVDGLMDGEIDRCRQDPGERRDVLRLLVESRDDEGRPLSDDEIRDQLRTQLIAGHETTGIVGAWALYWIHRDPELRERLREAVDGAPDDPDELAKVPLLEAAVKETLRIRPVVNEIFRRLARPLEIGGYELPPETGVGVLIGLVHRRPDLYPEPDRFLPDRFVDRQVSPWEFMPFGGGHRRCLGAALASYELAVVLGTLLREVELRLVDDGPVRAVRRSITTAPEGGVPMTFEGPRRSAAGSRATP